MASLRNRCLIRPRYRESDGARSVCGLVWLPQGRVEVGCRQRCPPPSPPRSIALMPAIPAFAGDAVPPGGSVFARAGG